MILHISMPGEDIFKVGCCREKSKEIPVFSYAGGRVCKGSLYANETEKAVLISGVS